MDEDHEGDEKKLKCILGSVQTNAGSALAWNDKIQSVVANSSLEKYRIAQARSIRTVLSVRKIMYDFHLDDSSVDVLAHNDGSIP